jgi:hypothetical protein
LFHRDSGGGIYAMRAKPRAGKRMRELHGEACGMSRCDQFVGVRALSPCVAGRKVLALRKGSTLRSYHAFSPLQTADPYGRGTSFHEDRFQDEGELGTLGDKSPAPVLEFRELLTPIHPNGRIAANCVFMLSPQSRFRWYSANTLFLGSGYLLAMGHLFLSKDSSSRDVRLPHGASPVTS